MLKSYKQLSRWYGALEPEEGAPEAGERDEANTIAPADDDAPSRYPDHIRDDAEPWQRRPDEIPSDLPAQRSEFTGGWSDWVVTGRAPGPDDDYVPPRRTGPAPFPWAGDDEHEPVERPRPTVSRALRQAARDHPAVRRARLVLIGIAAVVIIAVAAVGVLLLLRSAADRAALPRDTHMSESVQLTVGGAHAAGDPRAVSAGACPTERSDAIVRSAEAGGAGSGPDAVLSFQYAYYVERSGERARAAVAPDADVQPAWVIQRGIDSVPIGTTHCVRIVTVADNRYSVEVTEYRPGGAPATYSRQTVTTAVIDGRTLITGITAG
ncbi:hypothetical protein [Nocardia implantans]|uniref:DUF8176 domain-containing protein n=1 Tax=Nocardia implantans TaxID=3108168 RepID=A0ABU6B061_9NOCA|nr:MULTISPECIES: hypothetical protein [unclassified Nocardia]MBF6195205.1 hypothetical protein [Nocardia beijingensis]MEA3530749.1 hypothetical protein [Nocardia sp. CDC192]MEB3513121.1 hypothetical protein [Nocardia sp. CDC186]